MKPADRIARSLFAAQSLGSGAFSAALTVAAIAGAQLSGRPSWAGVPWTVYLAGAALAALGMGYGLDRLGRRRGLAAGLALGVLGALLAAAGVVAASFVAFLAGLALLGSAEGTLRLGRFVAAEVSPLPLRGRAISGVVLGGAVGAVVGPLLVGPSGALALRLDLPELSGPFAATLLLCLLAGAVILAGLRPEPLDLVRTLQGSPGFEQDSLGGMRSLRVILRDGGALTAVLTMVFAQLAMVMVMVITSLHMRAHGHAFTTISLVFSIHILGMYLLSPAAGRLADRLGRSPVIAAGSALLFLGCVSARLSVETVPLAAALFAVGLGWNLCYVAGSALLSDQLSPRERSRTQGVNDLLVSLASAVGTLGSGVVYAQLGFGAMGLVSGAAALLPLAAVAWWAQAQRLAPASVGRMGA